MPKMLGLVVTENGRAIHDQAQALRFFRDHGSTRPENTYRVYFVSGKGWSIRHRGNRILDTNEMRKGADNPGILIDQVLRIRGWANGK